MTKVRPYHHGNLETAILDLAVIEIETVGYEALSLRELAGAIGVSRAAPYRHFPSRLHFLEALIGRGLKLMNQKLDEAAERHADPLSKVRAVFEAYLAFADDYPQMYRLSFTSDTFVQDEPDEAFRNEAKARFEFLARFVSLLMPEASAEDLELRAIACWSFLNGFAVLSMTHRINHVLNDIQSLAKARHAVIEQCLQLPALTIQKP